jgi:hypothetical protein
MTNSLRLNITADMTMHNHTYIKSVVDLHAKGYEAVNPGVPLIWGETNSMSAQGRPGFSNAFGGALYAIDFSLCKLFVPG